MAARTAMMVVGVIAAVIAGYLVISAILGLLIWVVVIAVLAFAVVVAVKIARGSARATARPEPVTRRPARGDVDCAGERLSVGDTVRAGTGFDGPMELAFDRGVIVTLGRGKAHVRFDDAPDQIHPVTPRTLRRLG